MASWSTNILLIILILVTVMPASMFSLGTPTNTDGTTVQVTGQTKQLLASIDSELDRLNDRTATDTELDDKLDESTYTSETDATQSTLSSIESEADAINASMLTESRFISEDFAQQTTLQNLTDSEKATVNQFKVKEVSQVATSFAISSDYPLSHLNDRWTFANGASRNHFGSGWTVSVPGGGWFDIRSRQRAEYNPGDKAEAGAAFCLPNGEINGSEWFEAGLIGDSDAIGVGEDSGGEYVFVERNGTEEFKKYVDMGFEDCLVVQQDYSLYGAGEINWYVLEYRPGTNGIRELTKVVTYAKSGNTTINTFNLPLRFHGNTTANDDGYDVTLLSRKFARPAGSASPERVQSFRVASLTVDDSQWYELATIKKDNVEVPVSITAIEVGTLPSGCEVYTQTRVGTEPWNPSYGEFTYHEVADEENAVEVSTADTNVTRNGSLSGYNIGGLELFSTPGKKNVVGSEEERVRAEIGEQPASVLMKAASGDSCTVENIIVQTTQKR